MSQPKKYDIIVIGSGAAIKIAYNAAKKGKKVALIEKGPFGGTCVNRGCIPSKMLIYPADIIRQIQKSEKLNIHVSHVESKFSDLVSRVTESTEDLAENIQKHYEKNDNIDVYPKQAVYTNPRTLKVGDSLIFGEKVILAIGARARIPNIKGLSKTPYHTSTEALREQKQPKKLVIIGGGFVAAELGHFYSSMGTDVIIFARSQFLRKIDKTIRESFIQEFRKNHTIHEKSTVQQVSYQDEKFTVLFENERNEADEICVDQLLVATGRKPWTDEIQIEKSAVSIDENGNIKVDEFLKTTAKNTWALGDCTGKYLFRHMANYEASYLSRQILKNYKEPIEYPPIPYAIFTHPQIAAVGKTEQELCSENAKFFTGEAEYKKSDMGRARCSKTGRVKLIFDENTERLISAHILGEEAATMIHTCIAFIHLKATLSQIIDCVFIHPALPEVISSAAYQAKRNRSKS